VIEDPGETVDECVVLAIDCAVVERLIPHVYYRQQLCNKFYQPFAYYHETLHVFALLELRTDMQCSEQCIDDRSIVLEAVMTVILKDLQVIFKHFDLYIRSNVFYQE
jgi:hypothetical protein